ncbi:MAG: response regulator, partial [Bacteroidota bacterium]
LLIEVEDTGIGIKADNHKLLFSEFTPAENAFTGKYGGTGLGLAISKMLVEAMNGEIGVESTFNEGSTFWFTLKLEQGNTDEVEKQNVQKQEKTESNHHISILLAEDDPVNQKVARIIFGEKGVKVAVASNGREAVDKFRSGKFNMVVTDLMMPEMDGFQATIKIREIEKQNNWKPVPVVAMTAGITPGIRQKCCDAGMDAIVGKPVKEEELNKILDMIS